MNNKKEIGSAVTLIIDRVAYQNIWTNFNIDVHASVYNTVDTRVYNTLENINGAVRNRINE